MYKRQDTQTLNPLATLKEISEKTVRAQSRAADRMAASFQNRAADGLFGIGHMLPGLAGWGAYKTCIGSNGRISIPEAERDALGLGEGDLVQVIVFPVAKKSKTKREVKQ